MASNAFTPTRRGLLGFFAAAVPAAAVAAAPMVEHQPQDWRTKPISKWTKADRLAEADHQIADLKRKRDEIGRNAPTAENIPRYNGYQAGIAWWQEERAGILAA